MKKSDIFLIIIASILLSMLIGSYWIIFLKLLSALFLITLVLYWKIVPFKNQLFAKYQRAFSIIERMTTRLLGILDFIPKIQLGQHLWLDSSFIIYIIFLLTILIMF